MTNEDRFFVFGFIVWAFVVRCDLDEQEWRNDRCLFSFCWERWPLLSESTRTTAPHWDYWDTPQRNAVVGALTSSQQPTSERRTWERNVPRAPRERSIRFHSIRIDWLPHAQKRPNRSTRRPFGLLVEYSAAGRWLRTAEYNVQHTTPFLGLPVDTVGLDAGLYLLV